jgi:hypothetical protein
MIVITKNETAEICLTLSENQAASSGFYYFIFTNRATKNKVENYYENISTKENYQKFEIDGADYEDEDAGFYTYEVFESNDEGEKLGEVLELGYMLLNNEVVYSPENYTEQNNSFKTYNG